MLCDWCGGHWALAGWSEVGSKDKNEGSVSNWSSAGHLVQLSQKSLSGSLAWLLRLRVRVQCYTGSGHHRLYNQPPTHPRSVSNTREHTDCSGRFPWKRHKEILGNRPKNKQSISPKLRGDKIKNQLFFKYLPQGQSGAWKLMKLECTILVS